MAEARRRSNLERPRMESKRLKGTVTRLYLNKGFAFVRGEDRLSRFAHVSEFKNEREFDTLREGQSVEFTSFEDTKVTKGNGLKALDIKCLD